MPAVPIEKKRALHDVMPWKVSILIPAYNEEETIGELIGRIIAVDLPADIDREIIVVNDGSTDHTADSLACFEQLPSLRIINHSRRLGKGSAIRSALNLASGSICIIQDADLEYDPGDYGNLLEPIVRGEYQVVYGARVLSPGARRPSFAKFYLARPVLSLLTNILYGQHITDEPTCYKAFETALLKDMNLTCRGFEFCPEATAKVALRGIAIREVPISYRPRNREEGKKIRWIDGVMAVWTLVKFRFSE